MMEERERYFSVDAGGGFSWLQTSDETCCWASARCGEEEVGGMRDSLEVERQNRRVCQSIGNI